MNQTTTHMKLLLPKVYAPFMLVLLWLFSVFFGSHTVVLKVTMSCGGCSGAVKRVLEKMEGVESFDIDMEQQKVTVKGNVQPDAVFQVVSKTGKKTSFWEAAPPTETETKPAETAAAETETKPAETVAAA